MKELLSAVDYIIRLPLFFINYAAFYYARLSDYTQDRIHLILLAVVLATFSYWSPWLFRENIDFYHTFLNVLGNSLPSDSPSNGGLLYEYQALIAGFLAVTAGAFALLSPVFSNYLNKRNTRREFIMRVRSWAITTNVEVNSILYSEDPLENHNIKVLSSRDILFTHKEFYWSLSDDEAYKADSINNLIKQSTSSLEDACDMDLDETIRLVHLEAAIHSLCWALRDAEIFNIATISGHHQILDFLNDPKIDRFIERNKKPTWRFWLRNRVF